MEDYLIFRFTKCFYNYFNISSDSLLDHKFIYFEKEKFRHKGDVSVLKRALNKDVDTKQLIESSKTEWCLPLKLVTMSADYIHLFFDKEIAFRNTFEQIQSKGKAYGFFKTDKEIFLQKDNNIKNDLTMLRIDSAMELTERIVRKLGYEISSEDCPDCITFFFTNRSEVPAGCERVFVMGVEEGKKKCELTTEQYIRLHASEVSTMSNSMTTAPTSDHLVDTCVKFNLFHACVASPSRLSSSGDLSHNTKDAIFVVYNYVRLKTILNTFRVKVEDKVYPDLPGMQQTDISLLTKDEEWGILLDHLLRFPQLVAEFSQKLEKEGKLHLHSFFIMLVVFSNQISRYYRRVRILTEPKPHLMEVMFARLHLLSACVVVYDVLFDCLNIVPPESM